jgi:peptide/nickel transport system permease protein
MIRRLLAFIPSLLVVAVFIGLLIDFVPGDPVAMIIGMEAPQAAINQRRAELGLDRPVQVRLAEWLLNAAKGDFGSSYFLTKPVSVVVAERYRVTLSLTVFSLIVGCAVGIPTGIIASIKQGQLADWAVTTMALIWLSLPAFLVALAFIYLFAVHLRWFPVGSYVPFSEDPVEYLRHLVLPGVALGLGFSGVVSRFTRTSMLEVLRMDYVRTAEAKGLARLSVLTRHALRNALIPIITVIGIGAGDLLGGAVITESVFTMPGVGRMILEAVKRRDYPVIQAGVLAVAATYLVINLLVDLLYTWVDPRIRYE